MKPEEQLSELFGSYKAEWLKERMFDLFTEPAYFPELTKPRPCVLIGGRGTGKTTVLRCMSYEGQFVLHKRNPLTVATWPYYGLYYRVNTNHVSAFKGPEIPPERWIKVFSHYLNLVLCDAVLRFLQWYNTHVPSAAQLSPVACAAVAAQLHLDSVVDLVSLSTALAMAKARFEAYINNIADSAPLPLSLQAAPVDTLVHALLDMSCFGGKAFYFLFDEYENFEDYQQQIVNTLIKHSEPYTFKVGVREPGFRVRTTLNANEQLISPADYVRINIAEELSGERFTTFALKACNDRILQMNPTHEHLPSIQELLPGLTEEQEAQVLDDAGGRTAAQVASALESHVPAEDHALLGELTLLQKYFLSFWAENQNITLAEAWSDYRSSPSTWLTRYSNYSYALLYTLRRGKRGIQKYFCGWQVFTQLASGNLRFFFNLVYQCILLHVRAQQELSVPISYKTQTEGAQAVGRKYLAELEGLTVHGAHLTKLLLGLGRVFGLMAADPLGHAPEVNQFHLADEDGPLLSASGDLPELLRAAVMHLALIRFPGNKPASETDTREYDYMVHPIYSAFFVFSYRRKRKMVISGTDLMGLVLQPKKAIRDILGSQNRSLDEPLPDQLRLFEGFYDATA
ncbi:MAG: hypothetical protein NTV86_04720 [Planctomycetota bacterium]|nr:hypothetical protein [Planctomycetota bacterium]